MLHMLLWLYTHVSYVSDVCCKCVYLNVSKLDQGEHMLQLCGAANAWVTAPPGACNTPGVCHSVSSGFELKHDRLSGDDNVKVNLWR
jgi:hypothetical protein